MIVIEDKVFCGTETECALPLYTADDAVVVRNCVFQDLVAPGTNNGCCAVQVGSNASYVRDVTIENCVFRKIKGNVDHELHAILAYGENITIRNNVLEDIGEDERDQEGIYLKGSRSLISGNRIHNGAQIAICVKGLDSRDNIVANNVVTGESMWGIRTNGRVVVANNIVRDSTYTGISCEGLQDSSEAVVTGNYVEAQVIGVRLYHLTRHVESGNLISAKMPVKVD